MPATINNLTPSFILVRLALLFLISLPLACSDKNRLPNNTLVIGIENGPKVLDPRFATDAISSKICNLIYSSLFKRDKNLKLVPSVAEKVNQVNLTTYRLKLKEGILFHNGKELTARDVVFTFNSILDPKTKSPKKGALSQVESITSTGRYLVTFKLKEEFSPFLGNLTIGIVPSGSGDLSQSPIGSGAFSFESYQRGDALHLKSFKKYFGGLPKISGLVFKIVPDETVRILELKKGNVDIISNPITPALLPWLEKQENLKIKKSVGTNVSYIGFNMEDKILKNKDVRKAIALAINREAIAKYLMKGLVQPVESILAPSNIYSNKKLPATKYNPALARKLLDEAGYKKMNGRKRFKLTYKTSKNPTRKKIAEIFAEDLKKVGIEMEIKSFEWGTFFSDIKRGNFQLYSLTWVGIADPDIYHYIFHSSSLPPDGANRGRYINKKLDLLLEKGRREPNFLKRKKIYDQVQTIIASDMPYLHLWASTNIVVMNKRVNGFEVYPDESLESLLTVTLKERK